MDGQVLAATRHALHGLAELVLAGPQYRSTGDIRLRVTAGGFGTVAGPELRVDGAWLVGDQILLPLHGTYADLAAAAGVRPRSLRDVYQGGPAFAESDAVEVDLDAALLLADAFARGDRALRAFEPTADPVLWPEHFDIAATLAEVNYGVSPGDDHLAQPYAYVGPHAPRAGEFWTAPFGAARPLTELPDADAVADFFRAGRDHAARDPRR